MDKRSYTVRVTQDCTQTVEVVVEAASRAAATAEALALVHAQGHTLENWHDNGPCGEYPYLADPEDDVCEVSETQPHQ